MSGPPYLSKDALRCVEAVLRAAGYRPSRPNGSYWLRGTWPTAERLDLRDVFPEPCPKKRPCAPVVEYP